MFCYICNSNVNNYDDICTECAFIIEEICADMREEDEENN